MGESSADLTFWEHFGELRLRLIRCIVYILAGTIIGLFIANHVLYILTRPLTQVTLPVREKPLKIRVARDGRLSLPDEIKVEERGKLSKFQIEFEFESGERKIAFGPDYRTNFYYFNPLDPFVLWMKAALIVGVVLALPFIFMEVWQFVSPGLRNKEKKAIIPIIAGGVLLFPLGMAFAYFILSYTLRFLISYAFPGLEPRIGIMNYLNLALTMMIACGIVFELPIVIVVLSWIGIIHSSHMRKYRRYAIVILLALSAIITPTTDAFTMITVALPLIILYEISIILAMIIEKRKSSR